MFWLFRFKNNTCPRVIKFRRHFCKKKIVQLEKILRRKVLRPFKWPSRMFIRTGNWSFCSFKTSTLTSSDSQVYTVKISFLIYFAGTCYFDNMNCARFLIISGCMKVFPYEMLLKIVFDDNRFLSCTYAIVSTIYYAYLMVARILKGQTKHRSSVKMKNNFCRVRIWFFQRGLFHYLYSPAFSEDKYFLRPDISLTKVWL